jgi:hypothetical protein
MPSFLVTVAIRFLRFAIHQTAEPRTLSAAPLNAYLVVCRPAGNVARDDLGSAWMAEEAESSVTRGAI